MLTQILVVVSMSEHWTGTGVLEPTAVYHYHCRDILLLRRTLGAPGEIKPNTGTGQHCNIVLSINYLMVSNANPRIRSAHFRR